MLPNAEFPVLLAMDRRKLHGFNANVLELLGILSSFFRIFQLPNPFCSHNKNSGNIN